MIIRNLDGERSFPGVAGEGQVSFERDGQRVVIKATDGAGTGVKWLAGKNRCLTVRRGEGCCRDQGLFTRRSLDRPGPLGGAGRQPLHPTRART